MCNLGQLAANGGNIHLCIYRHIYVTVRVSNQGFSQIPKTFRESVKFLFHSRIRSLNVYGYD